MSASSDPRDVGTDADEPNLIDWLTQQGEWLDQQKVRGDDSPVGGDTCPDSDPEAGPSPVDQDVESSRTGHRQATPVSNPQTAVSDGHEPTVLAVPAENARRSWLDELSSSDIGTVDSSVSAELAPESEKTITDTASQDSSPIPSPIPLPRRPGRKTPAYLDENTYAIDRQDAVSDHRGRTSLRRLRHRSSSARSDRGGSQGTKRPWRTPVILGLTLLIGGGGAVWVAVSAMSDSQPVTPPPAAQTSVAPRVQTPSVDARDAVNQSTPDPKESTVGGTSYLVADADLPVMRAGQFDPRGAWVSYNAELYARNTDGVKAVLSGDSTMRDQDWAAVMSQIPEGSKFLLRMGPVVSGSIRGQLEVTTADGETTVYPQRAKAIEVDGRWFISEIKVDSTSTK